METVEPEATPMEEEAEARRSNVEASNPILANKNDTEKLKGDAIGNTLYSESGLLKTLISLSKFSEDSWPGQLEDQLCCLWDMTFEEDVIGVLMEHDFIDLACHVIRSSSEPRLMEILIGILGNMTARKDVRLRLSQTSTAQLLISLLSSSDTLTLLQLVRLFNSCVWHVNRSGHSNDSQDEDEQFDSQTEVDAWVGLLKDNATALNEHLAFILNSSTNEELLQSTLELLNNLCCITSKNHYFSEFLSTPVLLQGFTEALHQLLDISDEKDSANIAWGDRAEKAAQHWTQTLSAFSLHNIGSDLLYEHRQIIMRGMCSILDPLSLPENIFPLDTRKLEVIDSIIDVVDCLKKKHSYSPPALLPRMLTLLFLLSPKNENQEDEFGTTQEAGSDNDIEMRMDVLKRVYSYCFSVLCSTETLEFLEAFGDNPMPKIKTLVTNLSKCSDNEILKVVTIIGRHLG